jgi:cell wall-associated NlpC family hydrolase
MGFPDLQTLLRRLALGCDSDAKVETVSRAAQGFASDFARIALWAACVFVIGAVSVEAQTALPAKESSPNARLMSIAEGRAIVRTAYEGDEREQETRDCSHLVHAVYATAGFAYPYASSFEIYSGDDNFARVKYPRVGDVIAWPGHVGIVVNPAQHSFFSLVRTGLGEQDYESEYWRSRGRPRFYRLRIGSAAVLSAAKSSVSPKIKNPAGEK